MATIAEQKKRITLEPAGADTFSVCIDGQKLGIPMREEAAQTIRLWLATALEDFEKVTVAKAWEEPK